MPGPESQSERLLCVAEKVEESAGFEAAKLKTTDPELLF
jgi:hypothetical protein